MTRSARFFTAVVIVAGGICLLRLDYLSIESLTQADAVAVLFLVILGIVSEALPVFYSVGGKTVTSSIAFVPLFTIAVLFPLPVAVIAAIAIWSPSLYLIRKFKPWIVTFNVAQVAIAIIFGAWLYNSSAGAPVVGEPLVRLFLMSATFFAVNVAVIGVYLSLNQQLALEKTIRSIIGPGGSNLYYDLLVSPLALLAAIVYRDVGLTGLIALILPLLIIRYSYLNIVEIQHANKALLRALIKAIETRDPYTSGHSLRVSILARAIAEDLGMHGKRAEEVETASLLHDIGKVDGIYAHLIQKPHSLSPSEMRVIRTHATRGAEFVSSLQIYNSRVLQAIRHHHEKFDGSGYPDGMNGENIPIIARIIQIADSVDAMLSDRPYRPALPIDHVYSELTRCSGTQFDPYIVDLIRTKDTIARVLPQLRQDAPSVRVAPALAAQS